MEGSLSTNIQSSIVLNELISLNIYSKAESLTEHKTFLVLASYNDPPTFSFIMSVSLNSLIFLIYSFIFSLSYFSFM